MYKKTAAIIITFMIFILTACGKTEKQHDILEAKTNAFDTLDEMEEFSQVIIKGIRQKKEEPVIKTSQGRMVSGYTLSGFEITEIFKDTTNSLENGDVITILENEVYSEEENIVYHIDGYTMMETGKEYLLFLRKASLNKQDYYVSSGINFGTVSLEDNNHKAYRSINGTTMDFSVYEPVWEEARKNIRVKNKIYTEKDDTVIAASQAEIFMELQIAM